MNISSHPRRALSLLELLVVISIVAIMATLSVPAFVSIAQGSGMKRAVGNLTDALERARTEAMAQSTWVLVGIADTTESSSSKSPELTVFSVASKDGTSLTTDANLKLIEKPQRIQNVHLLTSPTAWSSNAALLNSSTFRFSGTVAGRGVTLTDVVAFSPQGEALLEPARVSSWIEIPIQERRGSQGIESKTASIRVSGPSGQVVVSY